MRWVGHVACIGEERKVYEVLMGKPEGTRSLRTPKHRWEDAIRMGLGKLDYGGGDSVGSG
jgi:hypothetical protein